MNLSELKSGESAIITTVGGEGSLRQHFLDMGLIPQAEVTLIKLAPMGDPMEFMVHGYELSIRKEDAGHIECEKTVVEKKEPKPFFRDAPEHPGLGEEGKKYHEKKSENPLGDDETITFALAGNQNCGKTTLFNQLTGSNQHVGNFPGVTVDRKSGAIRGKENTLVTDLPGIYSLSPYTQEEI
ncbi:MAG: FeoB small GTPase domain-containing protein, partial [Candidatus Ornithospirochaeta sp.]